ncbi:hypothetical protein BOTBODRAFT_178733 [Botryobasidium botryosum FD-172 SS1]|uniref:JmjC domain-containing protein n=1 Tax=Botryobasidium botryosum (strain FD-172 SS1) TaxID=930990 RepID=A0A067ME44_BOTB1|nr:hypothetical protein BOTBODRAFT_178733 [Botryobasidium botryosum FD-172 SS1]
MHNPRPLRQAKVTTPRAQGKASARRAQRKRVQETWKSLRARGNHDPRALTSEETSQLHTLEAKEAKEKEDNARRQRERRALKVKMEEDEQRSQDLKSVPDIPLAQASDCGSVSGSTVFEDAHSLPSPAPDDMLSASWLLKYWRQCVHPDASVFGIGDRVLQALVDRKDVPDTACDLEDLQHAPEAEIINVDASSVNDRVTKAKFVAGLIRNQNRESWHFEDSRIYNIPDILATSPGMYSKPFTFPPKPRNLGERPTLHSTPSPHGAITHSYIDFPGFAQLLFTCEGEKLWPMWPPTWCNLRWMEHYHIVPNRNNIEQAVKDLEGLEFVCAQRATWHIARPVVMHAVLTFRAACHGDLCYVSEDALEQSHVSMNWEHNRLKGGGPGDRDVVIGQQEFALTSWKQLTD